MKLGAISLMTDQSIAPGQLAVALEGSGFESFWLGDHSHIPVESGHRGPPLDTRTGRPVPAEYLRLLDPFLALTAAAAATTRLRVGTSICLVNERDPITTAKEVATLDHLSGGRFELGIGAGWNEQAIRDHGTDPRTRYESMRERLEAMKAIWTNDVAEYCGQTVRFGPLVAYPKPVQRPCPPVHIGGNFKNIPRVVAYADGWIPSTTVMPARAFLDRIEDLHRQAEAAGRPRLTVTALHVAPVDELAAGQAEFTDAEWDEWERAGVDRAVLMVPPARDDALRLVARYARFAARG